MAGSEVGRSLSASVRRSVAAALLLFGVALSTWACSSDAPKPPIGNGDIPPPLNQPCDADADCEAFGLKCDPLRGCLACVFDWHCAEGQRCTDDGCKVPSQCSTDTDCADAKAPHCDPVLSECVGCRFESDCPRSSHCVERSCTSYTACVNSRDCAQGTVCDRDKGECVECLTNADCSVGVASAGGVIQGKEACVAAHCVPVCASDKDCLDRNQLCHHEKGYCADCVEQEDCPSVYYCSQDLCRLDVCKAGSSKCMSASARGVCNAIGSDYDVAACAVSTTCSEVGGVAGCQPWICTPGTKDCDAAGQRVRECALDGLSYASEVDCAADGQLCHLAQCRPKVCEPGRRFCRDQAVHECSASGTTSTRLSSCGSNQYCDEASAACVTQQCTPGAKVCDGDVASSCDAIGSGPLPGGTDCAEEDQACYLGECRDVVCDGAFCQDGNAWACLQQGTLAELNDTCAAGEHCRNGRCYSDSCTAGQPVCAGNVASTCKEDGSGAVSGGTDCAASNNLCQDGVCVPKVCEPNSYYCSGGHPYQCNNNGTAPALQADVCAASEHCKGGSSYCLSDVCTAGAKMCEQNFATVCNTEGSGPTSGGTNCALDGGKVCLAGSCLPKICEPNEYFCQGGNSYTCGPTGATSTLNDTCLASEYCKPGTFSCVPDACVAAAPTCSGDNLSTCAADGSGPINAGASCATGMTCHSGACKPIICTLDALTCTSGNVQRCVDKGTAWTLHATCDATSYCNEQATPIKCSPDLCPAAAKTCNGEKLATCDADGGHFTATSTDCSLTNQVCTLAGTCLATAEDTVGDITSGTTLTSYMVGNIYRVDRTRKLTKIEQYLSVSGTSLFTWVVYEGSAVSSASFTKVFEVTTSSSGAGAFHSSGPISVMLQAGKFYYLGVAVQGAFTRYYASSATYPFVSFGQLWNAYQLSVTTPPATYSFLTSNVRYNQRISTADAP
jgi:hypothetical protein